MRGHCRIMKEIAWYLRVGDNELYLLLVGLVVRSRLALTRLSYFLGWMSKRVVARLLRDRYRIAWYSVVVREKEVEICTLEDRGDLVGVVRVQR